MTKNTKAKHKRKRDVITLKKVIVPTVITIIPLIWFSFFLGIGKEFFGFVDINNLPRPLTIIISLIVCVLICVLSFLNHYLAKKDAEKDTDFESKFVSANTYSELATDLLVGIKKMYIDKYNSVSRKLYEVIHNNNAPVEIFSNPKNQIDIILNELISCISNNGEIASKDIAVLLFHKKNEVTSLWEGYAKNFTYGYN